MEIATQQQRRPGYYVMKPDGTMDAKVMTKALTAENIAEFDTITGVVFELKPLLVAFEVAELAYQNVYDGIDEINSTMQKMVCAPLGGLPFLHDGEILMQQRVMAFLSAVRSFLDHAETSLSRRHGKNSSELTSFKEHTHRLYDKNFSYRFLYKLRDMSQHVTLPISVLNINFAQSDPIATPIYSSNLTLLRDELLAGWTEWKSVVKADLQGQPKKIDLLPLLDEQIILLKELLQWIVALRASDVMNCLEYLRVFLRIVDVPLGAVPVLWVGISKHPGTPPPALEVPPFEEARRIASIMGWCQEPQSQTGRQQGQG